MIADNPDLRFSQILYSFGFVKPDEMGGEPVWKNEFYTEPQVVLDRVMERMNE